MKKSTKKLLLWGGLGAAAYYLFLKPQQPAINTGIVPPKKGWAETVNDLFTNALKSNWAGVSGNASETVNVVTAGPATLTSSGNYGY